MKILTIAGVHNIEKVLIRALSCSVRDIDNKMNAACAYGIVNLMIRGMNRNTMGDTLFKEGVIRVFFSLKLIRYESNVPSDNKYF